MQIRELSALDPAELGQLVDLLVAVVDDGASIGFLPPLDPVEAAAYWRGVLAPDVALLVAEEGDRIVGTIQLHLVARPNGRHRAEVAKLMVHPVARRRGLGRRLVEAIEAVARRADRSLLVLDTREGDPSNALYRSLGYQPVGRIPGFARSGSGRLDATGIYYKQLAPPDRGTIEG